MHSRKLHEAFNVIVHKSSDALLAFTQVSGGRHQALLSKGYSVESFTSVYHKIRMNFLVSIFIAGCIHNSVICVRIFGETIIEGFFLKYFSAFYGTQT